LHNPRLCKACAWHAAPKSLKAFGIPLKMQRNIWIFTACEGGAGGAGASRTRRAGPWFGRWCGGRGRSQNHWEFTEFHAPSWFGRWFGVARGAPESLEMRAIPCILKVWAVAWEARAAPESLEMQRIQCISIVWVVLWGTGDPRIIGNALNSMNFRGWGAAVGGAGGPRIIANAFNSCISMVWVVLWGARVAQESLEMQRILCISMVWVVLWRERAAPESIEM
jgi:hypothetical protein